MARPDRLERSQVQGMMRAALASCQDAERWLRLVREHNPERRMLIKSAEHAVGLAEMSLQLVCATLAKEEREKAGETETATDNG